MLPLSKSGSGKAGDTIKRQYSDDFRCRTTSGAPRSRHSHTIGWVALIRLNQRAASRYGCVRAKAAAGFPETRSAVLRRRLTHPPVTAIRGRLTRFAA